MGTAQGLGGLSRHGIDSWLVLGALCSVECGQMIRHVKTGPISAS